MWPGVAVAAASPAFFMMESPMAIPRTRGFTGPALLSYGFRPFFLLGSLHAGLIMLVWLPMIGGHLTTASHFAPVDWHIHEMLFGYVPAIVTGFLLTAIPNWTGRLPVQGLPLLALVLLWLAGRLAIASSTLIGWQAAMLVDCAFLAAVAGAAATEIVAGRNWRNLKVLLPLGVLFLANVAFHLEVRFDGISDVSRRLGMAAIIVLITVIGGRIIPSFTRNWLVRENPGRLPQPFGRYDVASILASVAALGFWVVAPDAASTAGVMLAAGLLQLARLARWAGDRTLRDPLVLILHLAYLLMPVGFFAVGLSILFPDQIARAAGFHAFGTGAVGAMTLAVMVRATLGHTGQALRASTGVTVIFAAILVAATARILAATGEGMPGLVELSGVAWMIAFLGYAALFGRALMSPRLR
jgi:uncharacterized protein involved in response to NO